MRVGEVTLTETGPVTWITISNPAKHNAMSLDMWHQLSRMLSELPSSARCLVLRGEGLRAFVSGADIAEFSKRRRTAEDVLAYDRGADDAMTGLAECPIPTIAMISGYCFGGGVALALCCDVRLAAEDAVFSIPAARLGLGYGWRCIKSLVDAAGAAAAADLLISARRVSGSESLQLGVVSLLYAPERLTEAVSSYAHRVARNAPLTIFAARRTIRELRRPDRHPDLALCERLAGECFASQDYLEGIAAFVDGREPQFHGR
jgi:enoyl-CoA hydratase/carnithine racemase